MRISLSFCDWICILLAFIRYQLYLFLSPCLNSRKFYKNIYESNLSVDGTKYKVLYKVLDMPKKDIYKIEGEESKDISKKVLTYAGPNRDFSGLKLFPTHFGVNKMIVKIQDEEDRIFNSTDVVSLV